MIWGTCAGLWLGFSHRRILGSLISRALSTWDTLEGSSEPPKTSLHISLPVWAQGTWHNWRDHAGWSDADGLARDLALASFSQEFSLLHYIQICSVIWRQKRVDSSTALCIFLYKLVNFSNAFSMHILFCAWPPVRDSLSHLFLLTQIKKKCKGNDRSSCQTSLMAMVEAVAQEAVACMEGEVAVLALVRQQFWVRRGRGSTCRTGVLFWFLKRDEDFVIF